MNLLGVSWWWANPPDPAVELLARGGALEQLEREPAPELGAGIERWRMIGARGDTVTGLWKPPAVTASDPVWSVVMLGGIGTDDRAVLLVPDGLPMGVLAVSWPWSGPRRMGKLEFLARIPELRDVLHRTPGAIARGVEAVRRARPGTQVSLLGVSLGVPPTVAALGLTSPDALVIVDGAADLGRLMRSEIARALGGGLAGAILAPPGAALGARLVWSLEPARHPNAETPVLLVDAAREERYPPECVARLHATFPHASVMAHPGGHVEPGNRPAIAPIVDLVRRWLGGIPAESPRVPTS